MNSLQPPFSDIVGESSPVQKAIKLIWEIFANHPLPNNKSIASQSAAEQIVLHLLGTMNSIGMINAAGYHSAAVTLMRSIEDALDCLFAVVQSDVNANKWLNDELKANLFCLPRQERFLCSIEKIIVLWYNQFDK